MRGARESDIMLRPRLRNFGLFTVLAGASIAALINCASPSDEDEGATEDAYTGVDNAWGLGLRYDDVTKTAIATLNNAPKPGEKLHIRARRGTITAKSEADLNCEELAASTPAISKFDHEASTGKILFR